MKILMRLYEKGVNLLKVMKIVLCILCAIGILMSLYGSLVSLI